MVLLKYFLSFAFVVLSDAELYFSKDPVTRFNEKTFSNTFDNGPINVWFVQFYHSYCGHCINFAPTFKKFLQESQYWSWILNFGVVDCLASRELCKVHNIRYYPTFKLFMNHSYAGEDKVQLIEFSDRDGDAFVNSVASLIANKLCPAVLNLNRSRGDIQDSSYILIMGSNINNLQRAILTYYGRTIYPIYGIYSPKLTDYSISIVSMNNQKEIRAADFKQLHRTLSKYLKKVATGGGDATIDGIDNRTSLQTDSAEVDILKNPSIVFQQDIYSSIWYAFNNDITDNLLDDVVRINSLMEFLRSLRLYSGFGERVSNGLHIVYNLLKKNANSLKQGKTRIYDWTTILTASKLPKIVPEWINCKGSKPFLRRYPCGLWVTFHTLTINHYKQTHSGIREDETSDVIESIRNFIGNFFSCRECAQNFLKETLDYEQVLNAEDLVIYLWTVHNRVNMRLSGQPSDDPMAPKIAYPSVDDCSDCRDNAGSKWPSDSDWDQNKTLTFLIKHYTNVKRFLS